MIQRLLIIIGFIAIPFYELIFRIFPYVKVMAPDTRVPKELIAVGFALAIGLLAVFEGKIKPFKNKFLLLIPIYLLFSFWMSPQVDLVINNVQCGDFYFWKPFAILLCFALMIIAIASSDEDLLKPLNIMVWCGFIMSCYVIMQSFGFDQFWVGKTTGDAPFTPSFEAGGNLGNPTVVSSFIVLIIPLAMYFKKYWFAFVMALAVILTKSDMSQLSLLLISIIYVVTKFRFKDLRKRFVYGLIFSIAILSCSIYFKDKNIFSFIESRSSGRIGVWQQVVEDIRSGPIEGSKQDYSMMGVGFGRFSFLFPDKHNSRFLQAHNDLLEFTYNCGFFGLILLLLGLFYLIKRIEKTGINFYILLSLVSVLFCSFGGFPFQLAAHQFYSAILIGILHKSGGTNVV